MRTVFLGPRPPELDALIARRRASGLDMYDEVWEGDYHMAPMARGSHAYLQAQVLGLLTQLARAEGFMAVGPFNLGQPDDFRIPDGGVFRDQTDVVWYDTAAVVIEIESSDDETWEKLDFYARHGVDEMLVVSGLRRTVTCLTLDGERYTRTDRSRLLGLTAQELSDRLDWPVVAEPGPEPA